MAIEGSNVTAQQILGSMFFGTVLSFILHGVTCCQMIWFFYSQFGRSSKSMIALVIFVGFSESLNCAFIFCATLDMFWLPAVVYAAKYTSPCTDWIARAQTIPSSMCTFTVEGFFVMRVWRLSDNKRLTMLAFIPYLASFAFNVAQTVRSFQVRCNPNVVDISEVIVFGANGCRIFGDGIVATTMCYMLYRRSSGFTRRTNTIRIVNGLILWSISIGVLTWITSILFMLSVVGFVPFGFTVYFVRGGLYVNAMLAQLNARTRFRAIAQESIPLSSIRLGETSSSQPVDSDRELQPLDPA